MHEPSHTCPCCGFVVFAEPPGSYDVCPICYWEDDALQLRLPGLSEGANRVTLQDAQMNFLRHGWSQPSFAESVRPPEPTDRRDPSWRPFDPDRDMTDEPGPLDDPSAPEGEGLYYWRRHDPGRPAGG